MNNSSAQNPKAAMPDNQLLLQGILKHRDVYQQQQQKQNLRK